MPGFLTGLIGGLDESATSARKQAQAEQDKQIAREDAILKALASDDSIDPAIRQQALAGLTQGAIGAPRKKGFLDSVFGGKVQHNPAVSSLLEMITAAHPETGQPRPPISVLGGPKSTVQPGSAAMPPKAVQDGGGPQSPAQLAGPPPSIPVAPGLGIEPGTGPQIGTTQAPPAPPPGLFISPEDKMLRQKRAAAQGDVEGEVAGLVASGFTPDEARTMVKANYARKAAGTAAPYQSIAGELPDGTGAFGVFNRVTGGYDDTQGNPIPGFRPRTTAAARPQAMHGISTDLATMQPDPTGKGPPGTFMRMPDGSVKLVGLQSERDSVAQFSWTDAQGQTHLDAVYMPPSHSGPTVGGGAPSSSQAPAGPVGASPPPPAPGARGATGAPPPPPPPGGDTGPTLPLGTRVGVPGTAGAPPAVGAGSPGRISLGVSEPKFEGVTVKTPDGQTRSALKSNGLYYTENRLRLPDGTVEVPNSVNVPTAAERNMLDQIHAARPMMDRLKQALAGKESDNSYGYAIRGPLAMAEYKLGHKPTDPFFQSYIPLVSLMDVMITKGYLGGVRNQTWLDKIMEHTPKVTDSPANAFDKLKNIEEAFNGIEAESGGGLSAPNKTPTPTLQVDQEVTLKSGQRAKITKVYPDGRFDYVVIK